MTSYCNGSKTATITITQPQLEIIKSLFPPVNVTISNASSSSQDYTHSMTRPIDVSFTQEIDSVTLNDSNNSWIYGLKDSIAPGSPPNDLSTSCPLPGQAVVSGASGLIIEGKRLRSNFDVDASGRDAYSNNRGTCTSRVNFKGAGYELTITDTTGQIFKRSYGTEPKYTVACGDECPVGQIRIPTIEYPGYKCHAKCPPETCCECDCGDVICCYGSGGQVIKTISK